jgi:hypothetical protein
MTSQHNTAPTQFAEANGTRFAYRRFGNPTAIGAFAKATTRGGCHPGH